MKRKIALIAICLLITGALALRPKAEITAPECPVSLTNPDGQSLLLEKYDVRVAVHGPLSLVEMEMVFRNPEAKQMEGRFLYLLPPGATISRFAKEVNGKLMEGEVVERMRAQAVYTQILHTMRDPALLEMDQGNRFSARVFPIAANGTVRLVLGYSQLLPLKGTERKLKIALSGMPKIKEFSMQTVGDNLFIEKSKAEGIKKQDFTPDRDIEITALPAISKDTDKDLYSAMKAGNFQMLQYRPQLPEAVQIPAKEWSIYFDTSASNADTEQQRLSAIDSFLMALTPLMGKQSQTTFSAYAFDLNVVPLIENLDLHAKGGRPWPPELMMKLRARHQLGATNLEAVLKHIGEQARANKEAQRFVLVTDGIATIGKREIRDLLAALGEFPENDTLHALVIGNKQDEKTLNAIVEAANGRVVSLPLPSPANLKAENNGARGYDALLAKAVSELQTPVGMSYEFYDEGAEWIYPKTFRDVRAGEELIVFSQLKKDNASKPGVINRPRGKGEAVSIDFKVMPTEIADFAPLLQREAVRAYLDHLEKQEQEEKDASRIAEFRKKRVEVSTKNRVLCPLTSLLVLETEDDYARFGIERTALTDIMVVGEKGIELKKRGPQDLALAPSVKPHGGKRAEKLKKVAEAKEEEKPAGTPTPVPAAKALADEKGEDDPKDGVQREVRLAARDDDFGRNGVARERLQEQEDLSRDGRDAGRGQGAGRTGAVSNAFAAAPAEAAGAAAHPYAPTTAQPARPAPASETRAANQGAVSDRTAEPQQQRQSTDAVRRAVDLNERVATKPAAPEWIKQFGAIPNDAELDRLRAQVQADPRNRILRNAYATALKKAQKWDSLQGEAFEWLPFDPENPQVFEFLGNSATGLGADDLALRAITSIAEVAPNRAALLARAGWLLLVAKKYEMAEEMFRQALKNREDDCNIYRGLALSLWLNKKLDEAAQVLENALTKDFNSRYGDVKRVMKEELGYLYGAIIAADNQGGEAVSSLSNRAIKNGVDLKRSDALRVTLCWETDANDVDLHVVDPNGEECFYSHKNNQSGLELYSDQTQGLGPEVIRTTKAIPGTYHIGVNYFSSGPMGVSRGVVVVMQPNDKGIVENPQILPFCLIPGGPDMRHLMAAEFK